MSCPATSKQKDRSGKSGLFEAGEEEKRNKSLILEYYMIVTGKLKALDKRPLLVRPSCPSPNLPKKVIRQQIRPRPL
jgi:hypothetical protein